MKRSKPIYAQMKEQIRLAVATGLLQPGDERPPQGDECRCCLVLALTLTAKGGSDSIGPVGVRCLSS